MLLRKGDEFSEVLSAGRLLQCDRMESCKLVQCSLSCEGVMCLARSFEAVGEMETRVKGDGSVCMLGMSLENKV